MTTGYIRINM